MYYKRRHSATGTVTNMPDSLCPYCETRLVTEARPYALHGVFLGKFDFLVCPVCRRIFHPRETSLKIEAAARIRGVAPPEVVVRDNSAVWPAVFLADAMEPPLKIRPTGGSRGKPEVLVTQFGATLKIVIVPPTGTNEE